LGADPEAVELRFPNLMVCNFQSHSRHKVKRLYPFLNSRILNKFYRTGNASLFPPDKLDAINSINMTQFYIDTAPDIITIACAIGVINCLNAWQPVVTPMGVCYELRLHEMADYMKTNPFTQTNSVLGLIMAVNLTDITFGWHGFRSGVGVYYYHWTQPQSELRELSLTADMTLIAQLKMKKTILIEKSWWWPFSKCSTKPNENFCEHKMTEMEIIRNCSCSYGLLYPAIDKTNVRECNFTDMISCGNEIVQNFLFGRNSKVEHQCPPSCESFDFSVNSAMYRDRNKNALEIIKRKRLLPSDSTVFILELELKTSEIEFDIEKQSYPLNQMLSDGAGVFGFFLGISLLFVLQRLFNSIVKIMIDIKKCWRRFFRRFKRYNSVKHRCSLAKEEISYSFDQCRDLERYEVASKRNSEPSLPPPPPYFTH